MYFGNQLAGPFDVHGPFASFGFGPIFNEIGSISELGQEPVQLILKVSCVVSNGAVGIGVNHFEDRGVIYFESVLMITEQCDLQLCSGDFKAVY